MNSEKVIVMRGASTFIPLTIPNPVMNPAIPYVNKIPGGMNKDKAVVLQGTVSSGANWFEIDFKTGPAEGDNIAFHFEPHFGKYTKLNSCKNRNWEEEYRIQETPFARGAAFIVLIAINSECYQVIVNGVVYCIFKHRSGLETVSTLNVTGDVSLTLLGFVDNWSTTPSYKELKNPKNDIITFKFPPSEISDTVIVPKFPYAFKTPSGIHQDKAVFLQGILSDDANDFVINFKTGPSDVDDIVFHYNHHIGKYTTLNTCVNGNWDTEDVIPGQLFTKGRAFQMIVVINSGNYEVYVHGSRHCAFKHRISPEKITTIDFRGDLSKLMCGFINRWSKTSCCTEVQKINIKEVISTVSKSITYQTVNTICNPTIPYVGKISGGLKKDMAVIFKGSILEDAKLFSIKFKTDSDDLAFHYNATLGADFLASGVVTSRQWETEEFVQNQTFFTGEDFQIIVLTTVGGFQVFVNGSSQCTFKYHVPIQNVTTIYIEGNVTIPLIGFVTSWKTA